MTTGPPPTMQDGKQSEARPARRSSAAAGTFFGRLGLGPRLFTAMGLVVAAGAGTLLLVALLVAPQIFLTHLRRAAAPDLTPTMQTHVERAFNQATLLSLAVGVLAAVIAAGLLTWLVVRRLAAPITGLAAATTRLADGDYDATASDPHLGPEFAALTAAINQLAHRLTTSEQTRRRLLTDLGHELRTPLASLEATVEAITDGVLPADEASMVTLAEQTARMRRLVADLESVSRAEERQLALHPRPTAFTDIAHRAVTVMAPRYHAHGVNLQVTALKPGPTVNADADRLLEAVMNLLDNALRHTPEGGTVTVTVDETGPGDARRRDAEPIMARLTVTDTGDGFTDDQTPLLFDRFYRTDPARTLPRIETGRDSPGQHGSGIGLTITRAIIDAHHGDITAHSDGPGHGARFTILLPLAAFAAGG